MQEEDQKLRVLAYQPGQNLDSMSVDELRATIAMLHEEIERLDAAAQAKAEHMSAADALFAPKK